MPLLHIFAPTRSFQAPSRPRLPASAGDGPCVHTTTTLGDGAFVRYKEYIAAPAPPRHTECFPALIRQSVRPGEVRVDRLTTWTKFTATSSDHLSSRRPWPVVVPEQVITELPAFSWAEPSQLRLQPVLTRPCIHDGLPLAFENFTRRKNQYLCRSVFLWLQHVQDRSSSPVFASTSRVPTLRTGDCAGRVHPPRTPLVYTNTCFLSNPGKRSWQARLRVRQRFYLGVRTTQRYRLHSNSDIFLFKSIDGGPLVGPTW